MFTHAAPFCFVATLAVFGCSASRQEPTRPPALSYTGTLGSTAKRADVPRAGPERADSPRLVRNLSDVPRTATASPAAPEEVQKGRGLAIGGGPPPTLEPSRSIPSPPATLDLPPHAGVDATLKAMPRGVPVGHLNRETLEIPIRDRSRYERCPIPVATRVQIDAVVYNGKAVGVDVHSTPSNPALDFCVEQVVREASWVNELAVNRLSSTL